MRKKELTPLDRQQALQRAASLCSGSEHCTGQIRDKLLVWGLDDDDTEAVLARLVEEKFIDDRRFARAYCHDRFHYARWGRVKIAAMLRQLRLCDADISEALGTIPDEDYREAISEAVRQKDRTLRDDDPYRRKGKLVRHLLSRGFEMGLVIDAVDDFLEGKERGSWPD